MVAEDLPAKACHGTSPLHKEREQGLPVAAVVAGPRRRERLQGNRDERGEISKRFQRRGKPIR